MKMFLARRLWGLAQIADGLGMLVGLRFGLGLRVAKHIARLRAKRLAAVAIRLDEQRSRDEWWWRLPGR